MAKARNLLPMMDWNTIPWRKLERKVFKLQKRIYRASARGDVKTVRRLQKTLMRSWMAKCLAVRRVTQDNQGKKTAGVDGIKALRPKKRLELVNQLRMNRKAHPTRRVLIPKPGTKEKRPLGIPTMYDRALQALVKLALEPEWEARFEPNSYGFRPGRSCHDAVEAIFKAIRQKPKYVLDADIAKCFDRINHEALLEKLKTFPTMRRQIRAWLKAGVVDSDKLFPTSEGTPQGGVCSPLLANIALHGLENNLRQAFVSNNAPILIRYADDFVLLHPNLAVVHRCQLLIADWLDGMGLELNSSKTRLAHTLLRHETEEPGFNFLGFNIRQYQAGKYQSGKTSHGKLLGFKTRITPSKKKVQIHTKRLRQIIAAHMSTTQESLIDHLNPVICGWANYYSTVVSSQTYSEVDNNLYHQLRAWAKRRHPNENLHSVTRNYWLVNQLGWVFASKKEDSHTTVRLRKHSETQINRHLKVQSTRSPYDGDLIYWSTRMGRHPQLPLRVASLLKTQKGKCNYCGLFFRDEDKLEIDHTVPKSLGGRDNYENLQLLHRHCHDVKTADDISTVGTQELDVDYLTQNPF
jgi:RNA-directed DNA polymerase